MGRYIVKRLLLTVLVIVGAAILIFSMMYIVPGDPAQVMAGAEATPQDIENMRVTLGLDKPFLAQLGDFLYNVFLRFDFGNSWQRGTPVISGMMERFPRTLILGFLTSMMCVIFGIPLGVTAATHRGKWQDRTLIVGSMAFLSIPEFWLALLLIIVFSQQLGWLPSFGIETWQCYIMPVVAGSFAGICNVARQTRASVLDVVQAGFITTARAKGMKERSVIYKHMLPNALIPVITVCGNYFTRCVGGTIVMEIIFSFPGLGLYLSDAISMRDYPVIRGCVIFMAAFTALLMLVLDLAYAFADPRIKSEYTSSAAKKGKKSEKDGGGGHRHHRRHSDLTAMVAAGDAGEADGEGSKRGGGSDGD